MNTSENKAAREDYRELFNEVSAALFRHDPIRINFEDNIDEYDPEPRTILPRLRQCTGEAEPLPIVHEEFVKWFGADVAGQPERYIAVTQESWQIWLRRPTRLSNPPTSRS